MCSYLGWPFILYLCTPLSLEIEGLAYKIVIYICVSLNFVILKSALESGRLSLALALEKAFRLEYSYHHRLALAAGIGKKLTGGSS